MSAIHEFRCDSCKVTANAYYNQEHYLPPKGWTELFDRDVYSKGHLCDVCTTTLWHLNLRTTKVGKQVEKKANVNG